MASPLDNITLKDIPSILPALSLAEQEMLLAQLEHLEKLKAKKASRDQFLRFTTSVWPSFIGGRHHKIMADAFERVAKGELKRLIINMPPRHRLDIKEEIPTTKGWKTVETVQVGDYVFAPDGTPVRVTGKSAVYEEDLYEVVTSDGQVVVCDGEHLWTVRFGSPSRKAYVTLSTREILRKLETENWRKSGNMPTLPPVAPAQYPHRELPIPAYVLGVWLGDGGSHGASIGCSHTDAPAMRAQIEAEGYATTANPKFQQFNVLGLHKQLREQGLLRNKYIPEMYLCASVEQRLALLQGLIDTDGDVTKEGKVTFNNSNERLIDDVQCLVHSFGVKARKTRRQTSYKGKPSQPSFRIMFKMADAARLPRKATRCRPMQGNWARAIDVRRTTRRGKVRCLEVANEDGLFLAGRGYVCTHNTKSEFASYLLPAWFLGLNPGKKVIQCSHTAELAVGFGRKVRNLVDTEAYADIFPELVLSADSKAAGRWNTSKGGDYFAIGVGGAVTGKGADLLIIDDPHALEVSTPIATPKGFVALGDLRVGDEVYGPDGEPTKVIAKSPVYVDRPLYAVNTFDGETVYADAKHLWNVRTSTRARDPYRNLTTEELIEPRSSAFMIPRHSAVQYPWRELPVDPWVLGAWLGDGTSSLGRMTAHPDDAVFMRGEFKRRGYETTDLADKFSFGVPQLRGQLRDLGVLNAKRIPEAYMTAAFLQRMDLLCGLMDTDGNVTAQGQCIFHNKDRALVDQVVELLHSLGRKCQRRSYLSKGKFGTCEMHRVTFKLKDCALMPRKRMRTRTTHDKQHRSITVVPADRTGTVQCITVEREDGLFLAGRGYVVTHNSEQEAALAEINPDIYDKTYEWYTSGPRQRLQPGGAIVIVMCMTGDTPVMRPDGSETPLADLRVGDVVSTYEGGGLSTARVTNFQSNGFDDVFTVKTRSGITVKANERHPFLVEHDGVRKWARLRDLTPGMSLVRARAVAAPRGRSVSPDYAPHAKLAVPTTEKTPTRHTNPWATTVNGRAKRALVARLFTALVSACRATENSIPLRSTLLSSAALGGSSIATASLWANTSAWSPHVEIAATSAGTRLPLRTHARIGMVSCASTIAMTLARCADSCATTATSLWGMVKPPKLLNAPQLTYEFTADPIVEIAPAGREEVFDVEIERTENFIAGGLVVHNTRWSKRDLTGQILKDAAANDSLDEWEVIELPAILPSENPLWPEFWSVDELLKVKRDVPNSKWQAQYQQNPVSESAAIVKREWWKTWDSDTPPSCDFILQSWDTAFEKTSRADYSACTTWGVFYDTDENTGTSVPNLILLNAFRDRVEFPELKRIAIEEYKEWKPDGVIIEKKASGAPLIYEMRAMGIPVQEFTPTRGNDKISRLNGVADIFASGRVWAPATRWAEEVIDEVAEFPAGSHDDYVDTVSMALHRFRRGGYISTNLDEEDEPVYFKSSRNKGYY